ncbi:uncharacterized protein METZ01_LOCUS322377, partial [marine metagenome]
VEFIQALGEVGWIDAMMNSSWGWPAIESLHFMGLCLLVGTVGVFDMRMLGMGNGIPIGSLHGLVPWGVGGYAINVLTGLLFVVSAPDQYLYNPAFQTKLALMGAAGLNVAFFYCFVFAPVKAIPSDAEVPFSAKFAAAVSLICWVG